MPRKEAARIRSKIDAYASGQSADVKPLQGRGGIRLRVGDWRVLMTDNGAVIAIVKISPRGDAYKD